MAGLRCLIKIRGFNWNLNEGTYVCKLVIEVHISSAQVSSQQCGVSGEDGCNGNLPMSTQHQAQAGQPLMEMGHDVWRILTLGRVLQYGRKQGHYGQQT